MIPLYIVYRYGANGITIFGIYTEQRQAEARINNHNTSLRMITVIANESVTMVIP